MMAYFDQFNSNSFFGPVFFVLGLALIIFNKSLSKIFAPLNAKYRGVDLPEKFYHWIFVAVGLVFFALGLAILLGFLVPK